MFGIIYDDFSFNYGFLSRYYRRTGNNVGFAYFKVKYRVRIGSKKQAPKGAPGLNDSKKINVGHTL